MTANHCTNLEPTDRQVEVLATGPPAASAARRVHSAQSPKTSTTWLGAVKPLRAATSCAQDSTSSAAISTVFPQTRQMRWWWWVPGVQARNRLSPSCCSESADPSVARSASAR